MRSSAVLVIIVAVVYVGVFVIYARLERSQRHDVFERPAAETARGNGSLTEVLQALSSVG